MVLLMVLKDHWELRMDVRPESLQDRPSEGQGEAKKEILKKYVCGWVQGQRMALQRTEGSERAQGMMHSKTGVLQG